MQQILLFIERLSMWTGKVFGWCIIILTFGGSYEVFVRYVLRAPTSWAFDISYIMYGALFMMAGAYTVSRNGHVRGDVLYRLWPERVQAWIDLVLYITFFFPGMLALVYIGFFYAADSWRYHEVSVMSPAGVPIYPFKTLIPAAGIAMCLQGVVEVARCIRCIRDGKWPPRLHDVEETESAIMHEREFLEQQAATPTQGEGAAKGGER